MCGVAGFIDFSNNTDISVLEEMIKTLNYRGPDDVGAECYETENARIGFAQSRLSILDLSLAGHQPMHYKELSIVFNGEIYNFNEIRKDLIKLGHQFISETDTEVILHSYTQWGTSAVNRFIGMFAIVLFDRAKDIILFINDRAGVKPIYYYQKDNLILFSSELKAFYKHKKFEPIINTSSLKSYFDDVQGGHISAPYTIFENTMKIEQGTIITINLKNKTLSISRYWDINTFYSLPKLSLSYQDAKDYLTNLLHSAFNYRMVSDVPVGIFLSGGYDSTAVTAILQKDRTQKLKTFTIGFDKGNNEAD